MKHKDHTLFLAHSFLYNTCDDVTRLKMNFRADRELKFLMTKNDKKTIKKVTKMTKKAK